MRYAIMLLLGFLITTPLAAQEAPAELRVLKYFDDDSVHYEAPSDLFLRRLILGCTELSPKPKRRQCYRHTMYLGVLVAEVMQKTNEAYGTVLRDPFSDTPKARRALRMQLGLVTKSRKELAAYTRQFLKRYPHMRKAVITDRT